MNGREKIQNLKKDLESVCDLQKSLEEEVSILNKEKLKAEQKVQALSSELEQARTALADEWENHMTSDERLADAVKQSQNLQQSLSGEDLAGINQGVVHEIVAKEPDLPVMVDPASHSLELVPSLEVQPSSLSADKPGSPETSEDDKNPEIRNRSLDVSGIDDLFEEDEPALRNVQDKEPGESGKEEDRVPRAPSVQTSEETVPGVSELEPSEPGYPGNCLQSRMTLAGSLVRISHLTEGNG